MSVTDSNIVDALQYLNELKGANLVSVGRASALAWFLFAKDNVEYALHLQTGFRVVANGDIIFASADIFLPSYALESSKEFEYETFDWDMQGNNRYDERVNLFNERYSNKLIVHDVFANQFGDLSIQLSEKVKIEVFITMSKEECWRFFKRNSDSHLIITGEGVVDE